MALASEQFREIVENIFNRWTALKLAVEHGMGGRTGHQKAIELMNHTFDYCIQPNTPAPEDLQDALDDYLDQEFQTICDDNSSQEISFCLIKYLNMFRAGHLAEISNELAQLPPVTKWLNPAHKITYVAVPDDSSSESEEEIPQQIGAFTVTDLPQGFEPSSSGGTMTMEEEDLDPGWTKVTSKSRRKH
ncbi:uncharacterized protein LOC129797925 [Phlebotomus papatasi]|uniref:Pre-rRNA-processing protein TSR2 homolog n=1 Tax=Phlebotomus papatasi TaxID=29031 RepID=A0A1B0DBK6_PHLPP|nr:uncharacterized protein LOC129797925 [Phlebotomus papatasi]